jgi:Fe-S-cluster containining protein
MSSSDNRTNNAGTDQDEVLSYPAAWDEERLLRTWIKHLKGLMDESEIVLPEKRIRYQAEQNVTFQETRRRWRKLGPTERLNAWKQLLELSERIVQEVLPSCVQCGECCRKGSPTLQLEDLDLLRQGKLPWHELVTLRRSEPVHSPFQEKLFFLLDERIKIREKAGTKECVLFDAETDQCAVYANRPVQCRAQACWDPSVAKQMADQPYLTRRDIFKGVELLLDLMKEHDQRCGFEKLNSAFRRLEESEGKEIDQVLELLAYEDHFRHFLAEQLKIPENTLDLVFGRSFADLGPLFGFTIRREPDGSRCLVPDSAEPKTVL